ncbi:MAG: SH3 domain-containing protein [Butyrivibrio sp.]|nr:SH3 domain-containing protein [Butyrivibrio sp.]
MADKITNFEDYVRKEVRHEHINKQPKESEPEDIPVSEKTMEIEIEDPFQFLNEQERDEYLRQRHKEPEAKQRTGKEPGTKYGTEAGHKPVSESPVHSPEHVVRQTDVKPPKEEDFDEDDYEDEEFEEEYGEEYFRERPEREKDIVTKRNEDKDILKRSGNKRAVAEKKDKELNERKSDAKRSIFKKADVKGADNRKTDVNRKDRSQNDDESGINMDLVVRVASILTGIVILIFIAGLVKVKILDRFMAPDPDEVQVAVAAIPEGYTETADTVVVTAQALNLRTVPSTQSDETIVEQVSKGTQLQRLAVSDDGQWALLKWNEQQVYGYMKYMEVSQ